MDLKIQTYKKKTYRIKSKTRFCIFATLLVCLLVFIFSFVFLNGQAMTPINYKSIYICEGDTLWSIAGRYLPRGADIRAFIEEIKVLNDINDPTLYIGQELSVPIYPTTKKALDNNSIAYTE